MRVTGAVLCLLAFLLVIGGGGCGDDDAVVDAAADGAATDAPQDGGVDATPLCLAVADGGAQPPVTNGTGWARGATGTSNMIATISVQSDGDLVLGGRLTPQAGQTGADTTFGATLTTTGDEAFVARLSAAGTPSWIRATSGTGGVVAAFHSAAVGPGVAIGGGFDGTLTVDPQAASPVSLTTVATRAPFLARFGGTGGLVWARTATASTSAQARAVASTPASTEVWACGDFTGTLTLGPGEANATTLTADGRDGWLGRFGDTGALAWAVRAGGTGEDGCGALAVHPDGSSITAGVEAGLGVLRFWTAAGAPAGDVQIRGAGVDLLDVVPMADGGFAVAGVFDTAVQFEDEGVVAASLPAVGPSAFVARYQAGGALTWARQVTRPVNGLAARADGSLWGAGTIIGAQVVLNECQSDRVQIDNFDPEAFLARWDASGHLTSVASLGSYGSQFGLSVADLPGGAALAGAYVWYATFYPNTAPAMLSNPDNAASELFVLGVTAP